MAEKEYIERGAIIEEICRLTAETWGNGLGRGWWSHSVQLKDNFLRLIKGATAADVVEVVHGEWNEYFHFCGKLLKREPKERGHAPCMIVFCAFEQMAPLIEIARGHGYMHYQPLFFCKNYSAQVLKANMRAVGATEFALILYRDKLPKFRNGGKMVFDHIEWKRDSGKEYPKIHPTQKPVNVLRRLIEIYTDPGDVVIDPCAGSGSTLRAARELGRNAYGFEISRKFYAEAVEKMLAEPDGEQIGLC